VKMELEHTLDGTQIKHGYLWWKQDKTEEYKQVFPEGKFTIDLQGSKLYRKKVDWNMKRVYVGKKQLQKLFQKDELKIVKDRKIISESIEHKERMIVGEEGICLSEQSIQNLNTFPLAALLIYAIIKIEQKSDSAAKEAEENFLKHREEIQKIFQQQKRHVFPGEPKIINDLIEKGVINPKKLFYLDSKEENLELDKSASFIDSKEGILEFIKNVGKEAGFTKFVIKSSVFVRLPWLKRFFKMDESEVALSVPMEILRSGVVIIRGHILEIPEGFVNEVHKIYQKWPFLAVAMVDAIVCHEEAHRKSKITGLDDKSKAASEAEASAYLLSEQGLWGAALFVWYFTYYLNTRATVLDCIKWFGFELDRKQFEQIDELVKQIDGEYSKKGGDRAKRYRRKAPSRPAQIEFKEKMIGEDQGMFFIREDIILTPEKVELVSEEEYEEIMKKLISRLIDTLDTYAGLTAPGDFTEGKPFMYSSQIQEVCALAGMIATEFDYKLTLLEEYIEEWVEPLTKEEYFSYLREFWEDSGKNIGLNSYFIKLGYYFCLDITRPYPKPCFVGRFNRLEEAYADDSEGKKKIFKIVHLFEMIKRNEGGYYWEPKTPIYLLPATNEVIIFENLLFPEAERCFDKIKNFEMEKEDAEGKLIYKQWQEIKRLSREEIIKQIHKDLIHSITVEGMREAIDFLSIAEQKGTTDAIKEERHPFREREKISSKKLTSLALGPIPYYCLGKIIAQAKEGDEIAKEIAEFFVSKKEGKNIRISDKNFYEKIEELKDLDKFSIRKYAREMHEKEFNTKFVSGSLRERNEEISLEGFCVQDVISGKIDIDFVTMEVLGKTFINTGKVGNDDNAGWDKVVQTLGLGDINPENLMSKKVNEIIKSEEQWEGLIKLYPYLEMMKYNEVKDGTYLSVHWQALKRVLMFNEYKEELSISKFKEEQNYIGNKINEYRGLIDKLEEEISLDNKHREKKKEFQWLISDKVKKIEKTIESYKEEIKSLDEEIEALKNKIAVLKKGKKIEEKEEQIKECEIEIKKLGDEVKELIKESKLAKEGEKELTDKINVQKKQLEKYNEIVDGLEWEPKGEGSSLMMGAILPVIGLVWIIAYIIGKLFGFNLIPESGMGAAGAGIASMFVPFIVGRIEEKRVSEIPEREESVTIPGVNLSEILDNPYVFSS